jgi:hypothetical protein
MRAGGAAGDKAGAAIGVGQVGLDALLNWWQLHFGT